MEFAGIAGVLSLSHFWVWHLSGGASCIVLTKQFWDLFVNISCFVFCIGWAALHGFWFLESTGWTESNESLSKHLSSRRKKVAGTAYN